MREKTDDELVALTLAGDATAFREIYDRYYERARAVAFSVVRSFEDAEDVVQEAFVKAYFSLKNYRASSSFYTWLYRIVFNMALDVRRKIAKNAKSAASASTGGGGEQSFGGKITQEEISDGGILAGGGSQPLDPFAEYINGEQRSLLEQGLRQISAEQREVILLREVAGLDYGEIADKIGVNKGTVMSRLHYGRKALREYLGNFEELATSLGSAAVGGSKLKIASGGSK
ncbi:MAG TPA: RNA polymerase sigma factor [Oligoflexia bacterium]|nr:RNA polymerase sigma factor [Oligoflexia bacterium]